MRENSKCTLITKKAGFAYLILGMLCSLILFWAAPRMSMNCNSVIKIGINPSQAIGMDDLKPIRIPRIIHQTWNDYSLPRRIPKIWVKSWLEKNPGWEYWFWSKDDITCFIQKEYPWFLSTLNHYDKMAQTDVRRADAMRYFVLYHFGGVYADLDMECLKPLNPWLHHSCVLVEETTEHVHLLYQLKEANVVNGFMMSEPKHPLMLRIMKELLKTRNDTDLLKSTGPFLVNRIRMQYEKEKALVETKDGHVGDNRGFLNLTIADYRYFLPTYDPLLFQTFMVKCHEPRIKLSPKGYEVCKAWIDRGYSNIPLEESFTDHRWIHTYMVPNLEKDMKWNISDISPNLTKYINIFGNC